MRTNGILCTPPRATTGVLVLGIFLATANGTALAAIDVTLVGPVSHPRTRKAPNVYEARFPALPGRGRVVIANGEPSGRNRVSSATVWVNGRKAIGPDAFSQQVGVIVRSVPLLARNTIIVRVASRPGANLTLSVLQTVDAEAGAVVGESGGRLEVTDPTSPLHGAAVDIPPGALSEAELVTIALPSFPPQLPDTFNKAGPVAAFGPDGLAFASPATIHLLYNDVDNDRLVDGTSANPDALGAFVRDDVHGWQFPALTSVDESAHTVATTTTHFSTAGATTPNCSAPVTRFEMTDDAGWLHESNHAKGQATFGDAREMSDSLDDLAVDVWAGGGSDDRTKIYTDQTFLDGVYTWRVDVPSIRPRDNTHVAAWVIEDDGSPTASTSGPSDYELDFEFGHGTAADRDGLCGRYGADECWVLYLVTQANATEVVYPQNFAHGKYIYEEDGHGGFSGFDGPSGVPGRSGWAARKVALGRTKESVYEFQLAIQDEGAGKRRVSWFVNGVTQFIVLVDFPDVLTLNIRASVENPKKLQFLGEQIPPIADTHAYFDSVTHQTCGVPVVFCVDQVAFTSDEAGDYEIRVKDVNAGGPSRPLGTGFATSAVWSPDGGKLAYQGVTLEQIWVTDPLGITHNQVSSGQDYLPFWSPDSSRMVFISWRDANYEVYMVNADGTGEVNLTDHTAGEQPGGWSPDGATIIFDSDRSGAWQVYTMNVDTGVVAPALTSIGVNANPRWSPDGTQIAFESSRSPHSGNWELYVMNADGSDETRLTFNAGFDFTAVWSPNGDRIAWECYRGSGVTEICVIDPDDPGGEVNLTNSTSYEGFPNWSPDGARLAFERSSDIYVMSAVDGTGKDNLTGSPGVSDYFDDGYRAWRPYVPGCVP